jgi:hypothetical protein
MYPEGRNVFGLFALGFAGLVVLAAVGAMFGLVALIFWVVLLPFRLLGFAFRALGALLFLPLFLVLGLGIGVMVGLPLLFAVLVPALPVVLLVAGIWWLVRRGMPPAAPVR